MPPVFLGGYEDGLWCTRTKFGSGVAKAITSYVSAHCGGEVCVELNYDHLVDRLEFNEAELRTAVGHLIVHGYARINSNHPYYSGDVLELITPGRRAEDAERAEKKRKQEELRAAKIALRGGRINRTPIPIEVRAFVLERDEHRCRRCGSENDLTLDHIHPWSIGGPDTADNLQVLCRPCNSSKGDRVA